MARWADPKHHEPALFDGEETPVEAVAVCTPEDTATTRSVSRTRVSSTEYLGDCKAPCHVWAGVSTMQTIKANIETQLTSTIHNETLLRIAQNVFQLKWHGLPRARGIFDADGRELYSNKSSTGLFRREHDWDKNFYDVSDDRIYVTHIAGREEVATVAVSPGSNCLVTVMRHGEATAKQQGSMHKYVERAVLVEQSWLKGHMLDVVLKNCLRLTSLMDEKRSSLKEHACPRAVMDARIEEAAIHGSSSRSAVEVTLFKNIDPGIVRVKVGLHTVHVKVAGAGGEISGTLVSSDARMRRIVMAYVVPAGGVQKLDQPEHRLIARWLAVLVFVFLKHIVHTKPDHCVHFERYEKTLGRHKWAIPLLLHMVACDVQPNFLPATPSKYRTFARVLEDDDHGKLFMATTRRTATKLDVNFGELQVDDAPEPPGANPSCVAPGTSSFGVVAAATIRANGVVYCLNSTGK